MVLINDQLDGFDWVSAMPLLPPERQAKVLRYRKETDRIQCVAAWLLLRKACKELLSLHEVPPLAFGKHGKPFFPSLPQVNFNLSHCSEAVACVVDYVPVGIDIETVKPISKELMDYVLNDEEYHQVIASAQPDVTFMKLWTQKESFLKLSGNGLCDNLKSLLDDVDKTIFHTDVDPCGKYVYTLARETLKKQP